MPERVPTFEVQNAVIKMGPGWRGFGPDGDRFGHRGFVLVLTDPEFAQKVADWGYNVTIHPPYKEGEEPEHWLTVNIKFDDRFPMELMSVTKRYGERELNEETIECLDWADIAKLNVTIRAYNHGDTSKGGTGVTAYLKKLKAWIAEDGTMDDDEAPW